MEEKLKQVEGLLAMFDARDGMWAKHNRLIAAVIKPTVLDALYDLFDVPSDDVEWVDLQLMETVMLVVCTITYDPASTGSIFLQQVDQAKRPDTPIRVQRFLRIGIPLAIAFSPKDEIKRFLLTLPVESTDDDNDIGVGPSLLGESDAPLAALIRGSEMLGFDTSELSEDQIKKLMLYHHTAESTKQ